MILDILKLSNDREAQVLRAMSVRASFTKETHELCENLVETMFAADGVGLSAPQVGVNLAIFVMRTLRGIADDTKEHLVIVNPITLNESEGETEDEYEGCLSIPGVQGKVTRYCHLRCLYCTSETSRSVAVFSGLQARIYQHEFDHLLGKLFIDVAHEFKSPNVEML